MLPLPGALDLAFLVASSNPNPPGGEVLQRVVLLLQSSGFGGDGAATAESWSDCGAQWCCDRGVRRWEGTPMKAKEMAGKQGKGDKQPLNRQYTTVMTSDGRPSIQASWEGVRARRSFKNSKYKN